MKKLNMKKLKSDLDELDIQQTTKELIINNIQLYNDLVATYTDGNYKLGYFLYQLNMQIFKQLQELRKEMKKDSDDTTDDAFTSMIDSIKKSKLEKRG